MISRVSDAVKAYLHALEINPAAPETHFNLASAYTDLEDFKGATKHYNRAIEHDSKNTETYVCLA